MVAQNVIDRLRKHLSENTERCDDECKPGECDYQDLLMVIDELEALQKRECVTSHTARSMYERMDMGVPPQWKAEVGKSFRGTVLLRDARDMNNHCMYIEAVEDTECVSEYGETVIVKTGKVFTVGVYAHLDLSPHLGYEVIAKAIGKSEIYNGRWIFMFDVKRV